MYTNILPNLKNDTSIRSHSGTEAVDWVEKYFRIGSAYYFTQSDSEKQIGYRRGFYLGCCIERFIAAFQKARTAHSTVPIQLALAV